jgi:hypothetical protein
MVWVEMTLSTTSKNMTCPWADQYGFVYRSVAHGSVLKTHPGHYWGKKNELLLYRVFFLARVSLVLEKLVVILPAFGDWVWRQCNGKERRERVRDSKWTEPRVPEASYQRYSWILFKWLCHLSPIVWKPCHFGRIDYKPSLKNGHDCSMALIIILFCKSRASSQLWGN